jgi:hypothetical protein
MRNALLYKDKSYEGRMMLYGKDCSVLYLDDDGYYLDVFKPNHINYKGDVVCFFDKRIRQS